MRSVPLLPTLALGFALLFSPSVRAEERDFLDQDLIHYRSDDSNGVFTRTAGDLRGLFERYQPALGSQSRMVSPPKLTGSSSRPNLTMTLHKCIFVICRTVDLDADIRIQEAPGTCRRNMVLTADLSRSGYVLSDIYDGIEVRICLNSEESGRAQEAHLNVRAFAHHANSFSPGPVQRADYELLKLQVRPIIQALKSALAANGAQIH